MGFKMTITAGEILQALMFLISAFAVYNRLSVEINTIKVKVDILYGWWEDQVNNSSDYARRHEHGD